MTDIQPRKIAGYGFRRRAIIDPRDFKFTPGTAALPASFDDAPNYPPCYDQLDEGSCTANAGTGLMARLHGGFFGSRQAPYYMTRALEGATRSDAGAEVPDVLKVLNKLGIAPEADWPYLTTNIFRKPAAKTYRDALKLLLPGYEAVANRDIYAAIATGRPVIGGFTCYAGLESAAAAKTGAIPMPGKQEKPIGGHCVLFVGYTSVGGPVKIRNSWSPQWGDKGYGYLPAAYVADGNLVSDLFVAKA